MHFEECLHPVLSAFRAKKESGADEVPLLTPPAGPDTSVQHGLNGKILPAMEILRGIPTKGALSVVSGSECAGHSGSHFGPQPKLHELKKKQRQEVETLKATLRHVQQYQKQSRQRLAQENSRANAKRKEEVASLTSAHREVRRAQHEEVRRLAAEHRRVRAEQDEEAKRLAEGHREEQEVRDGEASRLASVHSRQLQLLEERLWALGQKHRQEQQAFTGASIGGPNA